MSQGLDRANSGQSTIFLEAVTQGLNKSLCRGNLLLY